MRPDGVVGAAPEGDLAAGVIRGVEDLRAQQRVAQTAVEAFDEGVSHCGLPGSMQCQATSFWPGPFQNGPAGELGAIVADDASRPAMDADRRLQFAGHPRARDAGAGDQTRVLAAATVDPRQGGPGAPWVQAPGRANLREAPKVSATKSGPA